MIENYTVPKKAGKDSLGSSINEVEGIFETVMGDGKSRLTIGSKTISGNYGTMKNTCGQNSMSLRSAVDLATHQLFKILDLAMSLNNLMKGVGYLMFPYTTFGELISKGEHLEHLHSYYNYKIPKVMKDTISKEEAEEVIHLNISNVDFHSASGSYPIDAVASTTLSMDMHTDVGLLIAMTTGYYSTLFPTDNTPPSHSTSSSSTRGLFITLSTGEIVNVDENDITSDDLIIMVGKGGAEWLSPQGTLSPLRAVPHALHVDLGSDQYNTRNWYGKMFQPPLNAELSNLPGVKYQQYREEMLHASSLYHIDKNHLINPEEENSIQYSNNNEKDLITIKRSLHNGMVDHSGTRKNGENMNMMTTNAVTAIAPISCTTKDGDPGVMCWAQCQATSLAGKECMGRWG